jgi:hypothetical protein
MGRLLCYFRTRAIGCRCGIGQRCGAETISFGSDSSYHIIGFRHSTYFYYLAFIICTILVVIKFKVCNSLPDLEPEPKLHYGYGSCKKFRLRSTTPKNGFYLERLPPNVSTCIILSKPHRLPIVTDKWTCFLC